MRDGRVVSIVKVNVPLRELVCGGGDDWECAGEGGGGNLDGRDVRLKRRVFRRR